MDLGVLREGLKKCSGCMKGALKRNFSEREVKHNSISIRKELSCFSRS